MEVACASISKEDLRAWTWGFGSMMLLPDICMVFNLLEQMILALLPLQFGGVAGDIEFAGKGTFKCEAGGVGSWGTSVDVGYGSADDLHNDFSGGIGVLEDGGEGSTPGPKDGMAVEMLLVLGFGCANGPEEGAGRV